MYFNSELCGGKENWRRGQPGRERAGGGGSSACLVCVGLGLGLGFGVEKEKEKEMEMDWDSGRVLQAEASPVQGRLVSHAMQHRDVEGCDYGVQDCKLITVRNSTVVFPVKGFRRRPT